MITVRSKKDFLYIIRYYNSENYYYLIKDSCTKGTLLNNIDFMGKVNNGYNTIIRYP